MKVLVVEDDAALRDVIVRSLDESGHIVDAAADGIIGGAMCAEPGYDAIVLDIMLPGRDGIDILRSMRAAGVATPVLLLTARTTESDIVTGLDAGADDYVRKPFGLAELHARLRSLARREVAPRELVLGSGSVRYDPVTRRATRHDRVLELTRRETVFLEYFVRNAGRVLSREAIALALWPRDDDIGSNVIDVYVKRLRTKLHGPGEDPVLHTVRGVGYRFEER
jgi:two-component system OmpR family response regulator